MLYLWEKGHFSKEYPNNTHKVAKLINSLQPLDGDLKYLYSEQSYDDEETIFPFKTLRLTKHHFLNQKMTNISQFTPSKK